MSMFLRDFYRYRKVLLGIEEARLEDFSSNQTTGITMFSNAIVTDAYWLPFLECLLLLFVDRFASSACWSHVGYFQNVPDEDMLFKRDLKLFLNTTSNLESRV